MLPSPGGIFGPLHVNPDAEQMIIQTQDTPWTFVAVAISALVLRKAEVAQPSLQAGTDGERRHWLLCTAGVVRVPAGSIGRQLTVQIGVGLLSPPPIELVGQQSEHGGLVLGPISGGNSSGQIADISIVVVEHSVLPMLIFVE